jgi:hypothetical protein
MDQQKNPGQSEQKCHHCGRSFNSQEELRRHESNCAGQKPQK